MSDHQPHPSIKYIARVRFLENCVKLLVEHGEILGYSLQPEESNFQMLHRILEDFRKVKEDKDALGVLVYTGSNSPSRVDRVGEPKIKPAKTRQNKELVNLNGKFIRFITFTPFDVANVAEKTSMHGSTSDISEGIRPISLSDARDMRTAYVTF